MKINFLPKLKREKVFKKGGFHTNPDVGWEIVLYIAFALALGSCVYGFFLFRSVNQGFASQEEITSQIKIVEKEKINHALQYFVEREKKSAQILNSPSPIVDPSR